MEDKIQILQEKLGADVLRCKEEMKSHTTFRTGGMADAFFAPRSEEELIQGLQWIQEAELPYFILGNGSNLLVSDDGIAGVVIHLGKAMSSITITENILIAQAGAMLSAVATAALQNALTGLEFASGIPGSVGGAVSMNAGAYGGEIKDTLLSARVLTKGLQVVEIPAKDLALAYRHSNIFEQGYILLSATFSLQKGDAAEIRAYMNRLSEQRREKQPLQYPSAGSTFKRPEGYFAGKLVQDAGLKGKTVGGAQVSEKHAGFLINIGNATTTDLLDLIAYCQKTVKEQFGVHLETEVKFVGRK